MVASERITRKRWNQWRRLPLGGRPGHKLLRNRDIGCDRFRGGRKPRWGDNRVDGRAQIPADLIRIERNDIAIAANGNGGRDKGRSGQGYRGQRRAVAAKTIAQNFLPRIWVVSWHYFCRYNCLERRGWSRIHPHNKP